MCFKLDINKQRLIERRQYYLDIAAGRIERPPEYHAYKSQYALQALELALFKMENGTYEFCTTCGERISPSRLKVSPGALNCIQCQRSHEEHGA